MYPMRPRSIDQCDHPYIQASPFASRMHYMDPLPNPPFFTPPETPTPTMGTSSSQPIFDFFAPENRELNETVGSVLYKGALNGRYTLVTRTLQDRVEYMTARISRDGDTLLHIFAALGRIISFDMFLKLIISNGLGDAVAIQNHNGLTPLSKAAISGSVPIAEELVNIRSDLPNIRDFSGKSPLDLAADFGERKMMVYLLQHTNLTPDQALNLLVITIRRKLYDVATRICQIHPDLAIARVDERGSRLTPLHILSLMPSLSSKPITETTSGLVAKLGWLCSGFAGYCLGIGRCRSTFLEERKYDKDTLALARILWNRVKEESDEDIAELLDHPWSLVFEAARKGHAELISVLTETHPDIFCRRDSDGRSILHVAVMHRHHSVFQLIYEMMPFRQQLLNSFDAHGNSILHDAAVLPLARNRLNAGAITDLFNDIMWYNLVKGFCPAFIVDLENEEGLTARLLFRERHRELRAEVESWVNGVATSCTIVATLQASSLISANSSVFQGVNTLPGSVGFLKFATVAILISLASILAFLRVLITCYKEDDFFYSLPRKLILMLLLLGLSILLMMGALCGLCLIYLPHNRTFWYVIPVVALLGFAYAIVPPCVELYRSTIVHKSRLKRAKSSFMF